MTATDPILYECPKCTGTGKLPHWRHIEGGVCFLCGGTKHVSERQASRYLAAQMDKPRNQGAVNAPRTDGRVSRVVRIAGLGDVLITRDADGLMMASIDSAAIGMVDDWGDSVCQLGAAFRVEGGAVKMDRDLTCDGIARREGALEYVRAALQAAVKVSA